MPLFLFLGLDTKNKGGGLNMESTAICVYSIALAAVVFAGFVRYYSLSKKSNKESSSGSGGRDEEAELGCSSLVN